MTQQNASDNLAGRRRGIARDSLMSLETYAKTRSDFRARVMAHKKARSVQLGNHLTLLFEDELTVRYQIQEMLRIEKTFEEQGIQDELDTYNALVPDGSNWKATLMLEYEDPEERRQALAQLKGVEDQVWVQVAGGAKVCAIAGEDLEREKGAKTSWVHFGRFELPQQEVAARKWGAPLSLGANPPAYAWTLPE